MWFRRALALVVLTTVGFGLQACATAPSGVLVPVTTLPEGAREVSMLVYSVRAQTDEPGVVYSSRRGELLTSVVMDVSIPPDHEIGAIEWPRARQADPGREFATLSIAPVPDDASAEAWMTAQQTEGHLLVFVHGFNVPFDRAVYSLAQLTNDSGIKAAPILFTWPSLGRVWGYVYDRESANYSRDALERLLRLAAHNPDVKEITILAHSMGSWIAVEALRQYAIREGAVDPKIDNVILAAPDLDVDVFAQQFAALGSDRPHFTFLVSRDDQALRISRLLAGGVQRVGALDPSVEPIRSLLEQAGGITIINLADIRGRDRLNHSVFSQSPEVVRLLGGSLVSGPGLSGTSDLPLGAIVLDVAEAVTSDLSQKRPVAHRVPQPLHAPDAALSSTLAPASPLQVEAGGPVTERTEPPALPRDAPDD
ncbi:alpha/beta hydrolase [Brevundimonas sp.]|uniref:alpha/beta hydrolase n=1 Tax=Brevundimonas sp. TaxID=1871086 RepID=UPI002896DA2E|nr:alpha/beta hydrolase [Brevundimonas sp.]